MSCSFCLVSRNLWSVACNLCFVSCKLWSVACKLCFVLDEISLVEISLDEISFDGIYIKETVTLKLSIIMNTTQIVEQDENQLGEITIEKADSSSKCKVGFRYAKYEVNPHRYRVGKPKKVKKIVTPEIRRERNRDSAKKCRDRKRIIKRLLESKNPPKNNKPKPLTSAERSKRYRDKKKNAKK